MKKIEHRYFGQLNIATTDDVEVIWEKEIQGIDTWLWLGKNVEPSTGILDLYAQFLENIDEKKYADYKSVSEWDKAMRLCECFAVIGWGNYEPVEALRGRCKHVLFIYVGKSNFPLVFQ